MREIHAFSENSLRATFEFPKKSAKISDGTRIAKISWKSMLTAWAGTVKLVHCQPKPKTVTKRL
jgi:hypothetical protein